jgi:hypothetical protein
MLVASFLLFSLAILTYGYALKNKIAFWTEFFLLSCFIVLCIGYYVANYFTGNGFTEEVYTTLLLMGLRDAGFYEYRWLIAKCIGMFVCICVCVYYVWGGGGGILLCVK